MQEARAYVSNAIVLHMNIIPIIERKTHDRSQ